MPGDPEPGVALSAFTVRTVSATQRKALVRTGRVSVTVTANAAGTITAKATAAVGGRSSTVAAGSGVLAGPGKVAVSLKLSERARAQLAARGRLTVKIAIRHSRVALDRSVTLRLVRARAKGPAAGQRKAGSRS